MRVSFLSRRGRNSRHSPHVSLRRHLAEFGRRLLASAAEVRAGAHGEWEAAHESAPPPPSPWLRPNLLLSAAPETGSLSLRQRRLIELSVAVANRHGGHIAHRVREAFLAGAGEPEVMEAISVAVWMGGTAAAAHGAHAREAARQMQEEWVAMPLVLRPA